MRLKFHVLFSALCFILLFSTCKKYPENNLWFKNPQKITFMEGHLTHWIVNGVDSIDYLDDYFENDFNNNPYTHSFADLEFKSNTEKKEQYSCTVYSPSDFQCLGNAILGIQYSYANKCKKIKITTISLGCYTKNIFIAQGLEWEIIYLDKKEKGKRKMKTIYNDNTYEIQFN